VTFAACLTRLEAEGTIDAERAARFRTEYDRLNTAYGKGMGKLDAQMQAGKDAMDALDYQAQRSAIQKVKQIGIQRELLSGFTAHIESGGKAGHYLAAIMDHHEGARGVPSVSNRRTAITNLAWSRMGDFVGRYKRNLVGVVAKRAELDEVARALRGEKVDNANAKLVADSVADTFEWLRLQFNRAGGDIPKLKNWGIPQSHDAMLIAKAGLQDWKAMIRPLLDTTQMIDNTTGRAFTDEAAIDEALDAVWRNISSEGMDGQVPGAFSGKGKLANRRADHRFLVFKDTDSWLAYNQRFGRGDVFDAITSHIDSMSQDIAAMQVLGPNPALTIRWMKDVANQDALPTMAGGQAVKLEADAADGAALMDRMWRYYAGALTQPHNRTVARFFQGARNWNVATKLGRAFVSAFFTDPMWAATNSKFNGLPQMKMLQTYVASFNPLDASHRDAARHAGIVSHELVGRTERMFREGTRMRFNLFELTNRSADFVLRSTFLTPSTIAWKETAALAWMKEWAEQSGKGFDQLGDGQRMAFERYGIDAADWDLLRSTAVEDGDGVQVLRPGDLARREDLDPDMALKAAVKYFEMIDAESKLRVVGEGLRAQTAAITMGGALEVKKGTVLGELIHSTTQFKTFGIAAMINSWQRTMYGQGAIGPKEFLFRTVVGVTLGGMLAEQMIQLSDGKDPLPWDETLLARGFARGGGAGLLGDILSQGVSNDRGNTVAGFALGPTASTLVDPAFNLTLANLGEAARGEETNAGRELMRTFKANLPGGNAWYAKLAMNRLFLEELDALVDPDVRDAHRRMEQRAQDQGTEFWWEPGESAPDRAPDLEPVLSNEQGGFEP
jgi:hypothetical protein